MKFPSFIPMMESKRRKRAIVGLFIEMFVWAYFIIFLVKILIFSIILPFIENLAYSDAPNAIALNLIQKINFDSRYFEFPWKWFFIIFAIGAVIGFFISNIDFWSERQYQSPPIRETKSILCWSIIPLASKTASLI